MKGNLKLVENVNKEMVDGLEALLELARRGQVKGMVYGIKHGPGNHSVGILGCFTEKPYAGKRLADKLSSVLDKKAQELEIWE